VVRSFGAGRLQKKIRHHLGLAQKLKEKIEDHPDFEILAPVPLNTLCFRFHPKQIDDKEGLNNLNKKLLNKIQQSGRLFLTHTKLNGKYTIRMVIGNTNVEQRHVDGAWSLIQETALKLIG